MPGPKEPVKAAIVDAQARLEQALVQLARMPAFDPRALGMAAHALNNYLTVTDATLEFMGLSLANHPDPQIHRYLQNLEHVTRVMEHTVSQLMGISTDGPPTLMRQQVDLPRLVERACHYYQALAARKQIRLTCQTAVAPREIETDPVILAAILDNLLSNAVKYSEPGKRIWVQVECGPDCIVCRVRDEGPGLGGSIERPPSLAELATNGGHNVDDSLWRHKRDSVPAQGMKPIASRGISVDDQQCLQQSHRAHLC